ncbi:hypothetical protein [Streptomyces sp. NPDC014734]|uniref:hypothetical protein n=1 Tax=Streptomyces sp. NPDC014734 TaxID=3364886 RepID=UPI0036F4C0EB
MRTADTTTAPSDPSAPSDSSDPSDPSARFDEPPVRRALVMTKRLVAAHGALSALVLAAVAVLAIDDRSVTPFMWGRATGVLVSAALTYWLTVRASRGARWAYARVRVIPVVVPFAIVGIDAIPGALPAWFVLAQAACAVVLAAAAFVVNGSPLRAAFSGTR